MRSLFVVMFGMILFSSSLSYATGIQVGRTRLIYDASKKEISLPLMNNDKELPWLIQSWTDTGDGKTKGPFIVTPPLFRLDPQKEQSLRIAWDGTAQPVDRESLFYMNVRTIPATAKEDADKNVLRLIYKTRLKLFWRPKNLSGTPNESCKNLQFLRKNDRLTVKNDGNYFTVFDSLKVGNTAIRQADLVAPKSSVELPMAGNGVGSQVSWRCITDYGNATDLFTNKLVQG